MSHLIAMTLEIMPRHEMMLAEVAKIGLKCNYMEKRLMATKFFSTHELVRQVMQLIQEYDRGKDISFGYCSRHAQALLSRAKMSWLSSGLTGAHADKLITFCILQVKEQAGWLDAGDYGVDGCFPGLTVWSDVEYRIEHFMNQGWLRTHDVDLHNVRTAKQALHSEIQDTEDFHLILLPVTS